VISYREIAKYAVNYNRASDMGGLEMEVLFEDSATNEDYTRYVSDPNDILRDENKKPFGVIMKIADAVNRIVGDYAMGRKLPMSEEMCCNVFSAFCDLTRASKEEVLALEGTDCVLGGILDDLDNKKKTAKFFKYVDHLDFYVWKCWCGAQLWEKESNLSAYMFGYVYRRLLDEKKSKGESFSFTDYIRIVNIEHQRWMRIHMCNGWTFGKKKIKGRRIHDCILPLYAIDANESYSYDLINAAWGMIKK